MKILPIFLFVFLTLSCGQADEASQTLADEGTNPQIANHKDSNPSSKFILESLRNDAGLFGSSFKVFEEFAKNRDLNFQELSSAITPAANDGERFSAVLQFGPDQFPRFGKTAEFYRIDLNFRAFTRDNKTTFFVTSYAVQQIFISGLQPKRH